MSCQCFTGLSSQAIACAAHRDHPHDPADLKRCVEYCDRAGISVAELRERMEGRSPEWGALLPHWGELVGLLQDEMATRTDGCASATYARMRALISEAKSAA
jgi:hypothetical protein